MNKIILKKTFFTLAAGVCFISSAMATTGGPDSYGYTYKDSNEPDGPVYNWIEIATPAGGSGTLRSALACDDCHEAGIPLGFNFPFYDSSFNQISIGSNGTVYFENVYLGLSNICIPGTPGYTMTQYNFIAHMWDDLAPNYQGGIYTQAFPNYFVIEFYDIVPCCSAGDGDTWQVILFKNGNILMQYNELSNQGIQTDYTVGIQNDPATGLQYRCDSGGPLPVNGTAILFSPPTFSCSTVSQNILADNGGYCTGDSTMLVSGATAIAQTWGNGSTDSVLVVDSVGIYTIAVLDTSGCSLLDTINMVQFPLPVVDLGADTTQCGSFMLDAGNPGSTYMWSDSSTTQTLTVNTSSSYSVMVTDTNGCTATDTVNVTIDPLPAVTLTLPVTTVCVDNVSFALSGGSPAGGAYSGTGVTGGTFDPATGVGTYVITYAYTDGTTGCADSTAQNLTVSNCTGISVLQEGTVNIYPNPTTGMITIETNSTVPVKVEICDILGKRLLNAQQAGNETVKLDLGSLINGVYFVKVNMGNNSSMTKILLNR